MTDPEVSQPIELPPEDEPKPEKDDEGRDEEAREKEQGEGLGRRETPPGQEGK